MGIMDHDAKSTAASVEADEELQFLGTALDSAAIADLFLAY
jgi:hypothetical protein